MSGRWQLLPALNWSSRAQRPIDFLPSHAILAIKIACVVNSLILNFMHIPVVDIFAGPGGLGEGFSAFRPGARTAVRPFKIEISAEMEVNAAKTLRLRAFVRQFSGGRIPNSYYEYVAGRAQTPWTEATTEQWLAAGDEARQLTLGQSDDDAFLRKRIATVAKAGDPWVLIGGPPCQAYSLVGRARNSGIQGYKAEEDHRHFLYTHYLKILREFRPAAFVMENVKGILSSRVGGELMFPRILEDLQAPGGRNGPKYKIVPMMTAEANTKVDSYLLRAEDLGVPQARHRVVLFGLRDDISHSKGTLLQRKAERSAVGDVIGGLPPLRSGVTDQEISNWADMAQAVLSGAAGVSPDAKVAQLLERTAKAVRRRDPGMGGRWMPKTDSSDDVPAHLKSWLTDMRLDGILNHEVRNHMTPDLLRYAYASAYAQVHSRSPRGASDFPRVLHPEHENWNSGKFVDRFKVQLRDLPSSTVTSHLAKDGHYFIHPDPSQLRSLSVREAARLQTFPDNYFFEGSRGAQYRQVGNAVPPWMAQQIAKVVYSFLSA
jgi:DNA (cytosine-5)-methyltransferase 1